jgi:hypothetical protein
MSEPVHVTKRHLYRYMTLQCLVCARLWQLQRVFDATGFVPSPFDVAIVVHHELPTSS